MFLSDECMSLFNGINIKNFFWVLLQSQFVPKNMMKKGKKKAKIVDYDLDVEISPTPRVEIIYEDEKSVTRDGPKFKWGQIYHMLTEKKV